MNKAMNETQASTPKSTEQVSNFVRATGRTRKAGYWLTGSGAAALLSAFLPWGSDGSGDTLHPTGAGVPLVLAIGGLLAYFGIRVLQDRPVKKLNRVLWVIAGVNAIVCIGFLASAGQASSEAGGYVSIQPTIGFYLGVAGLVATVVGAVLVRTIRGKNADTAQAIGHGH